MTVKELIKALDGVPQDARVITEGCDCYGDAGSIKIDEDDKTVELERSQDC